MPRNGILLAVGWGSNVDVVVNVINLGDLGGRGVIFIVGVFHNRSKVSSLPSFFSFTYFLLFFFFCSVRFSFLFLPSFFLFPSFRLILHLFSSLPFFFYDCLPHRLLYLLFDFYLTFHHYYLSEVEG